MKKIIIIVLICTISGFIIYNVITFLKTPNLEIINLTDSDKYEYTYKHNTYVVANMPDTSTSSFGIFYKYRDNDYLMEKIDRFQYKKFKRKN